MPEYRRVFMPGGTFFFTLVTYRRFPILVSEQSRSILRGSFLDVNKRFPFTIEAMCLLPGHLHCIWTLPDGDADYSIRWKEIKRLFSREYGQVVGRECIQKQISPEERRSRHLAAAFLGTQGER